MKVQLRSVAERELAEAIMHYRDIVHALGGRFAREFASD